ncbi:MAG TPA: PDZ domain-containing protein [Acidimicrobiia bacterium]|nr:PDZ domain-containing protein [Acidimicrobiia bacterium]
MRRAFGLSLLVVLVTACAGQEPPPRTPLPDAAQVVPRPVSCGFQVGEGLGVNIDDVIPDSGADGVLVIGDRLVAVNGEGIANADQLREALGRQEIGDTVRIDVIRGGEEVTTDILLGPNPDAPERPMLGVLIVTAFDRLEPDEVGTDIEIGALARAVGIGPSVYVLDPVAGNWASLGVAVPDQAWAAAGQAILTLENATTPDSALVDTVSGDRLVFDLGDWWAVNILGSLGSDTVLSVARPVPGETSLVEVAVVVIDFHERAVEWIWRIDQPIGVPVAAFPSPDGARLLIAGQDQEDDLLRYTVLSAADGLPMANLDTLSGAEGTAALGWFDDQSFLVSTGTGSLLIVDAASGVTSEAALPAVVGQVTRLTTVGDGAHLLAESGSSLIKLDLSGTTEIRTLADHCQVGVIGSLGWAAVG